MSAPKVPFHDNGLNKTTSKISGKSIHVLTRLPGFEVSALAR